MISSEHSFTFSYNNQPYTCTGGNLIEAVEKMFFIYFTDNQTSLHKEVRWNNNTEKAGSYLLIFIVFMMLCMHG